MISHTFLLLFTGAFVDAAGTVLIKNGLNNNSSTYLIGGVTCYLVSILFLIFGLKSKSILETTTVFIILNVMLIAAANHFVFGEILRPKDYVALFLGLISMLILES